MFGFSELIWAGLIVVFYFYWSNAQQIKEIAFQAVAAYCLKMEVQMLDGYVALNQLKLQRDAQGKMRMRRLFLFEFTSTGEQRYNGRLMMLGKRILSIQLDPHRI